MQTEVLYEAQITRVPVVKRWMNYLGFVFISWPVIVGLWVCMNALTISFWSSLRESIAQRKGVLISPFLSFTSRLPVIRMPFLSEKINKYVYIPDDFFSGVCWLIIGLYAFGVLIKTIRFSIWIHRYNKIRVYFTAEKFFSVDKDAYFDCNVADIIGINKVRFAYYKLLNIIPIGRGCELLVKTAGGSASFVLTPKDTPFFIEALNEQISLVRNKKN